MTRKKPTHISKILPLFVKEFLVNTKKSPVLSSSFVKNAKQKKFQFILFLTFCLRETKWSFEDDEEQDNEKNGVHETCIS